MLLPAAFSDLNSIFIKFGKQHYEKRKDALLTQRENEREKILKFSDLLKLI